MRHNRHSRYSGSNQASKKYFAQLPLRINMLPPANPSLSCVNTKSTLSPLKCANVLITLSGGTTGLSVIIRLSNFLGSKTLSHKLSFVFMMSAVEVQ